MLPFIRMFDYGNVAPAPKAIKKIAANFYNVVVLTGAGDLYVRGRNTSGQLGLGHTNEVFVWEFSTGGVKDVWVGANGIAIKKNNDEIWYSGDGFVVGAPSGLTVNTWTSAMVTFNTLTSPIKDMAISNRTCSVLLEDNTIWSTGVGQYGQLGNGTNLNNITSSFVQGIIPASAGKPVAVFAGSTMHSFIDTNGRLYYTGTVNAVNTAGAVAYNSYTASTLPSTLKLQNYHNDTSRLAIGIAVDDTNKNRLVIGGPRIFGMMADGANGSISNVRAFGLQTQSLMPSGDLICASNGDGYYKHLICTSTGIYGAGGNTGDAAGSLGTNTTVNELTYAKAVIPDSFDYENAQIICTYYRTYITDGNFVYSTGSFSAEGGPSTLEFVIDTPS